MSSRRVVAEVVFKVGAEVDFEVEAGVEVEVVGRGGATFT
jgi:hypothetical protein